MTTRAGTCPRRIPRDGVYLRPGVGAAAAVAAVVAAAVGAVSAGGDVGCVCCSVNHDRTGTAPDSWRSSRHPSGNKPHSDPEMACEPSETNLETCGIETELFEWIRKSFKLQCMRNRNRIKSGMKSGAREYSYTWHKG